MDTISPELLEHLRKIEPAETMDTSLGRILKNQVEEKVKALRALIRYNETRYALTAEAFYDQKIKDRDHTWEEEETYFDWINAQQSLTELEEELIALEKWLAHADR